MIDPSFWKNRRVLITGHTGFKGIWLSLLLSRLGSHICGYGLEPAHSIDLCNDSLDYLNTTKRFTSTIGDVNRLEGLMNTIAEFQPDIVIHLAAQALVHESYIAPILTWKTNVIGSLNLLEALRLLSHRCAIVMITTDKVYHNYEVDSGYREGDRLGGNDPYSASKAASEIAISSWRTSFVGNYKHQTPHLLVATARSGNVIGGGDFSKDRLIPDIVRAFTSSGAIEIRNPLSTRPWQHVLDPLSGYLRLAELVYEKIDGTTDAFNFGPSISSNKSVKCLVDEFCKTWAGNYEYRTQDHEFHEAKLLHLQTDRAYHRLGWQPSWSFVESVHRTAKWYKNVLVKGQSPIEACFADIDEFLSLKNSYQLPA
jgi:CDP-glucose 4,6-dehydratase